MSVMSNIAHFEPLSLSDYKNLPTSIVFINGCNFKCPTCHNYTLRDNTCNTRIPYTQFLDMLFEAEEVAMSLTISGGEPTIHEDLPDFIQNIKDIGFKGKIKLDTNGSNPDMVTSLLNNHLIDNVSLDVKAPFSKYPIAIGMNTIEFLQHYLNINESISKAIKQPNIYELRTTLVPLLTEEDIDHIKHMVLDTDIKFQKYIEVDKYK